MSTTQVPACVVMGPAGRSTVTESESIADRPAGSVASTRTFANPEFAAVTSKRRAGQLRRARDRVIDGLLFPEAIPLDDRVAALAPR